MTVRRAVDADADDIARVHVQAWREAYAHLVPAATLAGLDVSSRAAAWRSIIGAGDTDVWVAIVDGDVVGWASTSSGRDVDAPVPLELEGIYVLASHYGAGAGQSLIDFALGSRPAYLWMAADNPRAAAFYRRNGFEPDGASDTKPLAGEPVAIWRLLRR